MRHAEQFGAIVLFCSEFLQFLKNICPMRLLFLSDGAMSRI
jgi:hypothetical protein